MITIDKLHRMKDDKQKITCLTGYDATFAQLLSAAGTDIILVGDSLGNTIQGHKDTIPVSIDDMCYHTRCVKAGNQNAFILGDMPFLSYGEVSSALKNAAQLMQAGAQMVKLEGGHWLCDTVHTLTERGIPVCGHLGLMPQSVHRVGGYKVQGRSHKSAETLIQDALNLEKAGAQLLVLECIPVTLAEEVTDALHIPTIGIGAGPYCDGQVLVLQDMLGISPGKPLSFVQNFMTGQTSIRGAIEAYNQAVRNGTFPNNEQGFLE